MVNAPTPFGAFSFLAWRGGPACFHSKPPSVLFHRSLAHHERARTATPARWPRSAPVAVAHPFRGEGFLLGGWSLVIERRSLRPQGLSYSTTARSERFPFAGKKEPLCPRIKTQQRGVSRQCAGGHAVRAEFSSRLPGLRASRALADGLRYGTDGREPFTPGRHGRRGRRIPEH